MKFCYKIVWFSKCLRATHIAIISVHSGMIKMRNEKTSFPAQQPSQISVKYHICYVYYTVSVHLVSLKNQIYMYLINWMSHIQIKKNYLRYFLTGKK